MNFIQPLSSTFKLTFLRIQNKLFYYVLWVVAYYILYAIYYSSEKWHHKKISPSSHTPSNTVFAPHITFKTLTISSKLILKIKLNCHQAQQTGSWSIVNSAPHYWPWACLQKNCTDIRRCSQNIFIQLFSQIHCSKSCSPG